MATALTATPQPSSTPPSVLLNVTGAPNPPTTAYASNFTAGLDGWATSGTGNALTQDTGTNPAVGRLRLVGNPGPATASRTVTGLTVAAQYRLRLSFLTTQGQMRPGVTGMTPGVWVSGGTPGFGGSAAQYATVDYLFTATATSHVITVDGQKGVSPSASVYFHTVTVVPTATWQGTRITRTDDNGAAVPVRNPTNLDTVGGALTLTDYEAALTGTLTYTVTDGAGATATAVTSLAESRRNMAINPIGPSLVALGYWLFSRGTGAVAPDGTGLRLTITDALAVSFAQRINGPTGTGTRIPVTPGVTYTLSIGLRSNTAANGGCAFLFYDAAGALISQPSGPFVTLNSLDYTRASSTQIAPPLAAWLSPQFGLVTGGRNIGEWVDFQQVLGEKSLTAGIPFDGSTPASGSTAYAWLGAVNNSASIQTSPAAAAVLVPSLTLPATGPPPTSAAVTLVTDYNEAAESQGTVHVILGRTDKLSNPGTLLERTGTLVFFCPDYASAVAIRELLRPAAVALLRQATYPGMDLYFLARAINIDPAEPTPSRRWLVTVLYDEVPRP